MVDEPSKNRCVLRPDWNDETFSEVRTLKGREFHNLGPQTEKEASKWRTDLCCLHLNSADLRTIFEGLLSRVFASEE